MISDQLQSRFLWHAGVASAETDSRWPSVSECLVCHAGFAHAFFDLIALLTELNGAMNGPVPSSLNPKAQTVPRSICYAVAEVQRLTSLSIREVGHDPELSSHLGRWARRLEIAWLAVLAGDIDDIAQHIVEEENFGSSPDENAGAL